PADIKVGSQQAVNRPGSAPTSSAVQPGELLQPVLLYTGGPSDLAAGCGGDRPGRDQDEVRHVETVRA
ncbi:hypothetical protein NP51_13695, partial [Lacticaseibacillus rhamnosus]